MTIVFVDVNKKKSVLLIIISGENKIRRKLDSPRGRLCDPNDRAPRALRSRAHTPKDLSRPGKSVTDRDFRARSSRRGLRVQKRLSIQTIPRPGNLSLGSSPLRGSQLVLSRVIKASFRKSSVAAVCQSSAATWRDEDLLSATICFCPKQDLRFGIQLRS